MKLINISIRITSNRIKSVLHLFIHLYIYTFLHNNIILLHIDIKIYYIFTDYFLHNNIIPQLDDQDILVTTIFCNLTIKIF